MATMTLLKAINNALDQQLKNDKSVVLYGEDAGFEGGVFRVTAGLQKTHGKDRVFDTPISEAGIIGTAIGMASNGMRPVTEIQFSGFMFPGFNQMAVHMARMRNRSRGNITSRSWFACLMVAAFARLNTTVNPLRLSLRIFPVSNSSFLQRLMMPKGS